MNKKINWKAMFLTAGAFVSFSIGSGFASGNELLQFFGSWGSGAPIAVIAGLITTLLYCICLYTVGANISFEKSEETYLFFGGKILGRFFQVFVAVLLVATAMLMFSGAGSLLWQEFGLPQWVGSIILGVISVVVVLGGLKRVQNVLGFAGVGMLIYIAIFGIISLINPDSGLHQAENVGQMVEDGQIYQANMFTLPPFSWIPELEDWNSPVLEGILYGTLCVTTGFPFYLSLGKRSKNTVEAVGSAVTTAVAFYGCIVLVLLLILTNFDAVLNPTTNEMYPFPAVSAIGVLWPAGRWTYVVLIFVGIFTTYTGFLWSINNIFFENREKTTKSRVFVALLTVFGICMGSVIPFSQFLNILQPLSGVVGVIMVISIIVKTFSFVKARRNFGEVPSETQ